MQTLAQTQCRENYGATIGMAKVSVLNTGSFKGGNTYFQPFSLEINKIANGGIHSI